MPESTPILTGMFGETPLMTPTGINMPDLSSPDWLAQLPEGWLTAAEALYPSALARDRLVLELGSYKGRSTAALAQTALQVVSVDWHRGDEGTPGGGWTLPEYCAALRALGLWGRVVPVIGRIEEIGWLL